MNYFFGSIHPLCLVVGFSEVRILPVQPLSEHPAEIGCLRVLARRPMQAYIAAMRCPWLTTAQPPSLCMSLRLLAPRSMPHNQARRISTEAHAPSTKKGDLGRSAPLRTEFPWTCGNYCSKLGQ